MRGMWCWALLSVLSIVAAPALGATAAFSAHLNKRSLALGEALTLQVDARGIGASLSALKLDKLKRDFHVGTVAIDTARVRHKGGVLVKQHMTVGLYPLRGGTLRIAPFEFEGYRSAPLTVVVHASAPGVPRVQFTTGIIPSVPRVRQTALLRLTIYDAGNVQWAPIRLPSAGGLYISRISASQRQEIVHGVQQTVHRYVWEVMPLRTGDRTIRFPMLSADSFGSSLRYPVPPVHFHAARVPAYLPVYVPIGPVTLREHALPTKLAVGRPANWTLTVTGDGLTPQSIARLLGPIRGNGAVQFYPPSIVREKRAASPGMTQAWRVTVPFRLLREGRIVFPSLALAYFDPVSGRVESARLRGSYVLAIDPLRHTLGRGAVVLAALGALAVLLFRIGIAYRRYRVRRAALARVCRAADLTALRRALVGFGEGSSTAPPLTLRRWLSAIEREYGLQPRLDRLIGHLESVQFGPKDVSSDIPVAVMKSQVIDILRHLRALRRVA